MGFFKIHTISLCMNSVKKSMKIQQMFLNYIYPTVIFKLDFQFSVFYSIIAESVISYLSV